MIALLWLKESKVRGALLWAAGSFVAYTAAPPLADFLKMNPSLTGLVLGLFGMACVNKVFEVIQSLPLSDLVVEWLRKRFQG